MQNDDETKEVVKEAIKEWLDEQVKSVGWFAIKTIIGLAIIGVVYLCLIGTGHFK
jgi:hypothetical protein